MTPLLMEPAEARMAALENGERAQRVGDAAQAAQGDGDQQLNFP